MPTLLTLLPRRRSPLFPAIGLLVAAGLLTGQEPGKGDAKRSTTFVEDSAEGTDKYERAKAALAEHRWGEAAQLLRGILDAGPDALYRQPSGIYIPLAALAEQEIRGLPADGAEAYVRAFAATARSRLESALKNDDLEGLRSVAFRYPRTPAADAAIDILARRAAERGAWHEVLTMCRRRPEPRSALLRVLEAVAEARTGRGNARRDGTAAPPPPENVLLGDRSVPWPEIVPSPPLVPLAEPRPLPPDVTLEEPWVCPIPEPAPTEESFRYGYTLQARPVEVALHGHTLVIPGSPTVAIDIRGGQRVWTYGAPRDGDTESEGSPLAAVTVDGDRVYLAVGSRLSTLRLHDGSEVWSLPRDIEEGESSAIAPAGPQGPEPATYWASEPVLLGERLYVLGRTLQPDVSEYLVVFEAAGGKEVLRRFLCSHPRASDPWGNAIGLEPGGRLIADPSGGRLYAVCGGRVACSIDASTAEILWLRTYEERSNRPPNWWWWDAPPPVQDGGIALAVTEEGLVLAPGDGKTFDLVDPTDGTSRWTHPRSPGTALAAVGAGFLLMSSKKEINAYRLATGRLAGHWSVHTDPASGRIHLRGQEVLIAGSTGLLSNRLPDFREHRNRHKWRESTEVRGVLPTADGYVVLETHRVRFLQPAVPPAEIEAALAADPTDMLLRFRLARAMEHAGDIAEAAAHYARVGWDAPPGLRLGEMNVRDAARRSASTLLSQQAVEAASRRDGARASPLLRSALRLSSPDIPRCIGAVHLLTNLPQGDPLPILRDMIARTGGAWVDMGDLGGRNQPPGGIWVPIHDWCRKQILSRAPRVPAPPPEALPMEAWIETSLGWPREFAQAAMDRLYPETDRARAAPRRAAHRMAELGRTAEAAEGLLRRAGEIDDPAEAAEDVLQAFTWLREEVDPPALRQMLLSWRHLAGEASVGTPPRPFSEWIEQALANLPSPRPASLPKGTRLVPIWSRIGSKGVECLLPPEANWESPVTLPEVLLHRPGDRRIWRLDPADGNAHLVGRLAETLLGTASAPDLAILTPHRIAPLPCKGGESWPLPPPFALAPPDAPIQLAHARRRPGLVTILGSDQGALVRGPSLGPSGIFLWAYDRGFSRLDAHPLPNGSVLLLGDAGVVLDPHAWVVRTWMPSVRGFLPLRDGILLAAGEGELAVGLFEGPDMTATWRRTLRGDESTASGRRGLRTLLQADGRFYVGLGGKVWALDEEKGRILWSTPLPGHPDAAELVAMGPRIVAASACIEGTHLIGLAANDGHEDWRLRLPAAGGSLRLLPYQEQILALLLFPGEIQVLMAVWIDPSTGAMQGSSLYPFRNLSDSLRILRVGDGFLLDGEDEQVLFQPAGEIPPVPTILVPSPDPPEDPPPAEGIAVAACRAFNDQGDALTILRNHLGNRAALRRDAVALAPLVSLFRQTLEEELPTWDIPRLAEPLMIDGDGAEWTNVPPMQLDIERHMDLSPIPLQDPEAPEDSEDEEMLQGTTDDLRAEVRLAATRTGLAFFVVVQDTHHDSEGPDELSSDAFGLVLARLDRSGDVRQATTTAAVVRHTTEDDPDIGWLQTHGYDRWGIAATRPPRGVRASVVREETTGQTRYEGILPWRALELVGARLGNRVAINVAVIDRDAEGLLRTLSWVPLPSAEWRWSGDEVKIRCGRASIAK